MPDELLQAIIGDLYNEQPCSCEKAASYAKICAITAALSVSAVLLANESRASEKLLDEVLQFTGMALFLQMKVPALVIGAVRNGETTVAGFGKASAETDHPPDGKTLLRIGSITKPFTGAVLASLLADGKLKLMDPLQQALGWSTTIPSKDGKQVRLIDLVTHTSGLRREIERTPGPDNNPFPCCRATISTAQRFLTCRPCR